MRIKEKTVMIMNDWDEIKCTSGGIHLMYNGDENYFSVSQLKRAVLVTGSGLPGGDIGLVLDMGESAYMMMSDDPIYKEALFKELCKVIPIDYKTVIEACNSTMREEFELYRRKNDVVQ